jgi:hypothetical protein
MLKYRRLVGIYGEDDDARQAPELPEAVRAKIETAVQNAHRALPPAPADVDGRESLLLLPGERAA